MYCYSWMITQMKNLKVMFSICLIFCQFQPGIDHKSVAYVKKRAQQKMLVLRYCIANNDSCTFCRQQAVGNKAKGRISKRVFQEYKAAIFSEKRTFLPHDTHTYVSIHPLKHPKHPLKHPLKQSWNTPFEIRPYVLSPTSNVWRKYSVSSNSNFIHLQVLRYRKKRAQKFKNREHELPERRVSLIKQKVKKRVFTKQTDSAAEKVIFFKKNQTKTERKKKVFTTHSKYIETKIVLYLV